MELLLLRTTTTRDDSDFRLRTVLRAPILILAPLGSRPSPQADRMHSLIDLLVQNQLLLLFAVIGLGYLLGSIEIGGLSLGTAAVLFAGMAFGAVDRRLDLPEYIYVIGLVLFVYAIGLQSGPGFFVSFQKRGFRVNFVAVLVLATGAAISMVFVRLMHLSAPSAVGLFCGALTNTPALAATVETVKSLSGTLPEGAAELYAAAPVVTYGLAYPFGVLGVILWFFLCTRLFKIDVRKELKDAGPDEILSRTYRVTNPAVVGKTATEILASIEHPGFVLSRIRKGAVTSIVSPETSFSLNDLVVAVGPRAAQERARLLFGELSGEQLAMAEGHEQGFSYRRIFVSNKDVVGNTIGSLQLERNFDATITRLRRGDVDFVPSPDTSWATGSGSSPGAKTSTA